MSDSIAIYLENISKIYRLYGSERVQLSEVLGFGSLLKRRKPLKEYIALQDISLIVPRGHRIGIIGRNGAGKTTLLKLICGNYTPTAGKIKVNGTVQALMSIGIGFHPEYTGRENVEASLHYNGLSRSEYKEAIENIIDFCELGDFLDQPFKTYSMGMQGRLMFASATAIKPDILIVDEVLGAGDSYFVAKSKNRVERLVNNGCTMLLVSHSMQQVLELCEEVIWLDQGRVRMQGDSFQVVKAYEEFMHGGPIKSLSTLSSDQVKNNASDQHNSQPQEKNLSLQASIRKAENFSFQVPFFRPHNEKPIFPEVSTEESTLFRFEAPGGISRWDADKGLKICGFTIVTENGISNTLIALQPVKFVIFIMIEEPHSFKCRYGIAISDLMGEIVTRIYSPIDEFSAKKGEIRQIEIILNPNQLGSGDYILGISILDDTDIEKINIAKRFDLLNKSFSFKVTLPDSLGALSCRTFHSAEWIYNSISGE